MSPSNPTKYCACHIKLRSPVQCAEEEPPSNIIKKHRNHRRTSPSVAPATKNHSLDLRHICNVVNPKNTILKKSIKFSKSRFWSKGTVFWHSYWKTSENTSIFLYLYFQYFLTFVYWLFLVFGFMLSNESFECKGFGPCKFCVCVWICCLFRTP